MLCFFFHGKLQNTAKLNKPNESCILTFVTWLFFLLAEIPTQLNIGETSTLDVQTTMNPSLPQNIHIGVYDFISKAFIL